jgi:prophage maintenance system killer protein/prophage antirepressor-like protein
MRNKDQEIILFETDNGKIIIDVKLEEDTVWLNLNQLCQLFEKDKSVISRHLKNIFKEGELEQFTTVAKFATVQQEGRNMVHRNMSYYNLDVVISVGYRVHSSRGIQFRQWASQVLKEYIVQGYSLREQRIYEKGIAYLQQAIDLLARTIHKHNAPHELDYQAAEIIKSYAKTWNLLVAYDENQLQVPKLVADSAQILTYDIAIKAIQILKNTLIKKKEASNLFGQQRNEQLQAILGAIHQTFGGTFLYPSSEERAAHLLYFTIKDHPFVDGNKRIGSFLFLFYMQLQAPVLSLISDSALVSVALLIAESDPKDKDLIIKLIMNLIVRS